MFRYFFLLCSLFLITGCQKQERRRDLDDLNSIKKDFLFSILEGKVEESPFQMRYVLKTVFFSQDVISLFGEVLIYDHLPHATFRYEGKTLCRIKGRLTEIKIWDLFSTEAQREYLRKYCENSLKGNANSYFSGANPLRERLEYSDIHTFVINDEFLVVIFQPYTVGGLEDGPWEVKIPYEYLKGQWSFTNPFPALLDKTISSKSYTSSWDQENYAEKI